MPFEFATAARIIFARRAIAQLPDIAREFGDWVLVVTGRDTSRASQLLFGLKQAGIKTSVCRVAGEPTVDAVRDAVRLARGGIHFVIGFGGGSAIDAAKAIAAVTPNSGEPLDYLELIGKGQALDLTPLPFIAVPTTAGTGAEVTRNAVLGSPQHAVKASLRSPLMLAKVALIDPDLTLNLPPQITATTGLDALTQLIEPYVSVRANALTDVFCLEGMQRVSRCLRVAYRDGHDRDARESMSFASLLGGLALANSGLGVVHGFAAPLGGMLDAPHGAMCAAVLPHGMTINIRALRDRAPENEALRRYDEIARILTGNRRAGAEDGAGWVAELCQELSIEPLRHFGLEPQQIPMLVEKAAKANSMKGNPLVLTPDELSEVAVRAL